MAVQIQIRRDTTSNWASNNPILASGEIGIDTDLYKFKIGNGSSNWNSLNYANALPSELSSASANAAVVALGYANSASVNAATVAQGYANTAQSNAETTALGYANSASANAVVVSNNYTNLSVSSASALIISSIVNSAPETLDTLKELADALDDDPNFATTITNSIATKLSISAASTTYATIFSLSNASATVDSSALSYANSASANAATVALGYANAAQTAAESTALGYANSASANAATVAQGYANTAQSNAEATALGYANSASAHVSLISSNLYVTKNNPLFTENTIIDLRSASVMFTSASVSGISTGGGGQGIEKNIYFTNFSNDFYLGNGSSSAIYFESSDLNIVELLIVLGSTSSVGNGFSFSLPNTPKNGVYVTGQYKSNNYVKPLLQKSISGSTVFVGFNREISNYNIFNKFFENQNNENINSSYLNYDEMIEDKDKIFSFTSSLPRTKSSGDRIEILSTYEKDSV